MPNLVGIGNSQVPTNAMLGGLAYQDSVGEIDIDKIKAKISDTAVDVFVYDTRKDSDGGAWRHRTQDLSWYNEGASATRGARKEFPAVAVLVLQSLKLTIYDGDDPNLPMWMVVTGANNNYAIETQALCTAALNGIVCIGCGANGHDFYYVNFLQDAAFEMSTGGHNKFVDNIATRSSHIRQASGSSAVIISRKINDVSMTVLPNAPTDVITGLQVPTIAIATDSGISVITNDGTTEGTTVYDLTTNNETSSVAEIAFLADNRYSFATKADNSRWWVDDIQTADENHNYFYQRTTYDYSQSGQANINPLGRVNGTSRGEHGEAIFRQASGMSRIRYIDRILNYTTTNYNTGWMPSDIRGAFLSDTDDTDVTGTYLYLDNFSNNDKGWGFADNGSDGISGGVMTIANNTSARATDGNALTGVATGTKLLVKFTVTFGAAGTLSLDDDGAGAGVGGNTNLLQATKSGSGTQTFSSIYTKTASNRVRFIRTSGGNFQIDDFEMKILPEDDRSVKNNGLAVYGTITKSPVATGAELVAYSGFSASNYLQQPYNSNLDFGTGNWSYMFWYNANDAESGDVLFTRWSYNVNSSTAGRIGVYFNGGNLRCDTTDDGASSYQGHVGTDGTQNSNAWHCGVVLRRSGNLELYVDGNIRVNNTLNSTSDGSYTNSSAILEIGNSPNMGSADSGIQLALLRASASAPSAKQIKKMYDDEKCLFHENAKCTLYGTSNVIKAVAYDDTTDILHVGTSSGRSEFRGLNRINNTTTAVTTEISASNGLVAEQ